MIDRNLLLLVALAASSPWPLAAAPLPPHVDDLPVRNVTDLAIEGDRLCATTSNDAPHCWRFDRPRPSASASPAEFELDTGGAIRAAVSRERACVLTGNPSAPIACFEDRDGEPWHAPLASPPLEDIRDLTGDPVGFCALGASGDVDCWAWQAGERPEVGGLLRDRVPGGVRIAGGPAYACVLSEGEVWCSTYVHSHNFDQPRHSDAFAKVPQLRDVVQIAVTPALACARRRSGQVLCWQPGDRYDLTGNTPFGPLTVAATPAMGQMSLGGDRLCGVTERGRALCLDGGGGEQPLEVADALRIVVGEGLVCALRSGGKVRCWSHPPETTKLSAASADLGPEYPNALGQLNITFAMGGGARTAPDRLREKIFEMGMRGAFLFGRPARDRRGWGLGPVIDLRTADFDSFGMGAGLGGMVSIVGPLQLDLRGGYGVSRRHNEKFGNFLFGTGSLAVRFPLEEPDRAGGGPRLVYAWPLSVYVSVRRNVERPFVHEWTVGFETDPVVWIGMPIFAIYEIFHDIGH